MHLLRIIKNRIFYILLLLSIGLLIVIFNYPRHSSYVFETCLSTYDGNRFHQSSFHSSMVYQNAPTTLDYWVRNKIGFEIGGPSQYTWTTLGVYDQAAKIDVTNFAVNTLWEKDLKDQSIFMWNDQPKGTQYVRDGVDLTGIRSDYYDFVLASHVIEHIANPFKALLEWIRILRSGGFLMIIAPFKNVTFDHKRKVDRIEHLIRDYHSRTTEADLSHLEEILRLHDLSMDLPAGDINFFRARSEKNFQNRGLHHHVYDQKLLYDIYICLNLDVVSQYTWSNNQLIIGQKK